MEPVLAIVLALSLLLGLIGIARVHPSRRVSRGSTRSWPMAEREAAIGTQIEIEEHDIDEMIEAQNALRRRLGAPEIGEELAEQARRPPPEDTPG